MHARLHARQGLDQLRDPRRIETHAVDVALPTGAVDARHVGPILGLAGLGLAGSDRSSLLSFFICVS